MKQNSNPGYNQYTNIKKQQKGTNQKRMNNNNNNNNFNTNVPYMYMPSGTQNFYPTGFQQDMTNQYPNNYMNGSYNSAYPGSPTKMNTTFNIKCKKKTWKSF